MTRERDLTALDEAVRHCRAGLITLETARSTAEDDNLYPTHLYVAAVELAHAIEVALQVALRSG